MCGPNAFTSLAFVACLCELHSDRMCVFRSWAQLSDGWQAACVADLMIVMNNYACSPETNLRMLGQPNLTMAVWW